MFYKDVAGTSQALAAAERDARRDRADLEPRGGPREFTWWHGSGSLHAVAGEDLDDSLASHQKRKPGRRGRQRKKKKGRGGGKVILRNVLLLCSRPRPAPHPTSLCGL